MAARVGGRNLAVSWIVGILCVGVIGVLVWFAIPLAPVLFDYVGAMLRSVAP